MTTAAEAAQSPWVERAARAGHVAEGILYAVVALLALQIPLGLEGDTTDRQGALRTIAQQPAGEVMLFVIAGGLVGYAAWRFAQAFLDRDGEGTGIKALAKRASYLGRGLLYAGLALTALALVIGWGSSGGNEQEETARVFELPGGRWVVAAIGAGFLVAGVYNAYRSVTGKFRKHLREHMLGPAARGWTIVVGVLGHAARAVVFVLVGVFLLRAAWQYDPQEAIGLDGALRKVAETEYGELLLGLVAAGLLAYGFFCFVQARCRRV
jgi:Domain of Unknown Function (DUF1206)